jgi:hypothetical protein
MSTASKVHATEIYASHSQSQRLDQDISAPLAPLYTIVAIETITENVTRHAAQRKNSNKETIHQEVQEAH